MSKAETDHILSTYLQEYQTLKAEQTARIGFRDNLLYVTLVTVGGVLSFSLANQNYYALLLIPWVCTILGWTYLVNDEKITAIGRYIQLDLAQRISNLIAAQNTRAPFRWETAHRKGLYLRRRKIEQLVVDELAFVVSGVSSLVAFWTLTSDLSASFILLSIIEGLVLLILGIEIFLYFKLAKKGSLE